MHDRVPMHVQSSGEVINFQFVGNTLCANNIRKCFLELGALIEHVHRPSVSI